MTTLVLAEGNEKGLCASTFQTINAAMAMGQACHVLVLGKARQKGAQEARSIKGVEKVLYAAMENLDDLTAEKAVDVMMHLKDTYDAFVAPANTYGKNIMPRLAALLDVMQISDVITVQEDGCFIRPIYAGNLLLTVKSSDQIRVVTFRPSAFSMDTEAQPPCTLEEIDPPLTTRTWEITNRQSPPADQPDLSTASVVVSGGRGLQSKEQFHLINDLANTLKGAVGASRAAVDAGYIPNDHQVGQTGKVVAPRLYIAIGISGAIQHLAGMRESKTIVAINKDEEAPIFQIADYGLVGDLFEIVPELIKKLG